MGFFFFFAILWCNHTSHSTQFELAKFSYRSFVWVTLGYFACQVEKIRPLKPTARDSFSQRLTLVSQLGSDMIDKLSSIHLCMKILTWILLNFVTPTCFLSTGIFFQEIKKGSYLSGKCIYQGHANSIWCHLCLKEIQIYSNLSIQNCPNKYYSSKNVFPSVGIPTSIQIGNSCVQSLKNPSSKLTNFDPLLKHVYPRSLAFSNPKFAFPIEFINCFNLDCEL